MSKEVEPLLVEYFYRKRLASLGYTFNTSGLSNFKAECFVLIGDEYDKATEAERKRKSKSKG